MDATDKIVPLHLYPLGFIESFTYFGARLDELLADTGINPERLREPGQRISYAQQNQLLKNGIGACRQAGLGLLVGGHFDWCFYGTLGAVVNSSPSLKDTYNAFYRYISLAQPYCSKYAYEKRFFLDSGARIVGPILLFAPVDGDPVIAEFQMEFQLAIILRMGELCGNRDAIDCRVNVCLEYDAPSHAELYKNLPCDSVEFGRERSSISASTDFVMKSWRKYRKPAFDRTMELCELELEQSGIAGTLADKVRWFISTMYFKESICLEDVAEKMHMSSRVLTRRLSNEGTTFRTIYHEVRMEITTHHLVNSNLNLDELAELMRFSDVSSMRRAIKNWQGCSISAIRPRPMAGLLSCEHSAGIMRPLSTQGLM